MDINAITTVIGSLGFPIVMSMVLIKMMFDTQKQHEQESKDFTKAIDNNTAVIERLITKLGKDEGK